MTCEIPNIYRNCGECFKFYRPYNYLGYHNAIGWSGNIDIVGDEPSYAVDATGGILSVYPYSSSEISWFHNLDTIPSFGSIVSNGYIISDRSFPENSISGTIGCQALVTPDIIGTNSKIKIGIDSYGIELSEFTSEEVFDEATFRAYPTLSNPALYTTCLRNNYYCKVSSIAGNSKLLFAKDRFFGYTTVPTKISWTLMASIPLCVSVFIDGNGKFRFVFNIAGLLSSHFTHFSNFYIPSEDYILGGKQIFLSTINDNSTPMIFMNYAGSFSNGECKDYSNLSPICPDNTIAYRNIP